MRFIWVLAPLGLAGCLPAPPEPAREPPAQRSLPLVLSPATENAPPDGPLGGPLPAPIGSDPWTSCYQGFTPGDDVAADLARLTSACGAATRMRPVTPIHQGAAADEGGPVEQLSFRARKGRCYRVFAIGTKEAIDVDLAIYAPDGRIAAGDGSRDRFPIVPPRGPLCVRRSGTYTIAVGVTRGKGDWLLQIWGTDEDDEEER